MTRGGSTRRHRRWRLAVLETYGTTCHLCGRAGATSADHIVPVSVAPWLAYVVSNGRPAHISCNSRRGARPLRRRVAIDSSEFFDAAPSQTPRVPVHFPPTYPTNPGELLDLSQILEDGDGS